MRMPLAAAVVSGLILGVVAGAEPAEAPAPPKPTSDEVAPVTDDTEFALDLYGKLRSEPGNLFLSPYSISSALAMTYAGARGRTVGQMAAALHFTLPNEQLHPTFGGLTKGLNEAGKTGDFELAVANAPWGQKGEKWLPEFLVLNQKHHRAGLNEVDFKQAFGSQARVGVDWVPAVV